jgi:hypothetical protein
MDLTAHGARFLNDRPCTYLCRWMVYSRVTTSCSALRVLVGYIFDTQRRFEIFESRDFEYVWYRHRQA